MMEMVISITGHEAELDERNLAGADHVNDECLREQTLYKPTRLEKGFHIRPLALEYPPQHHVGDNIEYRTDWSNPDHESAQVARVPHAWFGEVFPVHAVERNGGLRNIIKQILNEQMNRKHRQERQKGTRCQYAEHVSEVGT